MLRRAGILEVIVQCLLRDIDHTELDLRICSHYGISEALENHIVVKDQRNRYSLV